MTLSRRDVLKQAGGLAAMVSLPSAAAAAALPSAPEPASAPEQLPAPKLMQRSSISCGRLSINAFFELLEKHGEFTVGSIDFVVELNGMPQAVRYDTAPEQIPRHWLRRSWILTPLVRSTSMLPYYWMIYNLQQGYQLDLGEQHVVVEGLKLLRNCQECLGQNKIDVTDTETRLENRARPQQVWASARSTDLHGSLAWSTLPRQPATPHVSAE